MTSPRQRAANRENALRSTGPRSEAGRRRVAGNAQRHGLSASIPDAPVQGAFVDILARDGVSAADLSACEQTAAVALARAEVACRRARAAERAVLVRQEAADPEPDRGRAPGGYLSQCDAELMALLAGFRAEGVDPRLLRGLQPDVEREAEALLAMLRHRDRAETARRKARWAWAAARRNRGQEDEGAQSCSRQTLG